MKKKYLTKKSDDIDDLEEEDIENPEFECINLELLIGEIEMVEKRFKKKYI